jgi:hypothetical protein
MAKSETVIKKVAIELLDESKEYTIVGTGKNPSIEKGVEYLVGGQTANILIGKGFASVK